MSPPPPYATDDSPPDYTSNVPLTAYITNTTPSAVSTQATHQTLETNGRPATYESIVSNTRRPIWNAQNHFELERRSAQPRPSRRNTDGEDSDMKACAQECCRCFGIILVLAIIGGFCFLFALAISPDKVLEGLGAKKCGDYTTFRPCINGTVQRK